MNLVDPDSPRKVDPDSQRKWCSFPLCSIPSMCVFVLLFLIKDETASAFVPHFHRTKPKHPSFVTLRVQPQNTRSAIWKNQTLLPPVARREEDRVVYAGVNPNPSNDPPRQSQDSNESLMDPPSAIPDMYGWMRDDSRRSEEVLDYIAQENEYTRHSTQHLRGLQQQLQQEYETNLPNEDISQLYLSGNHYYFTRRLPGQPYPIHCRVPRNVSGNINSLYNEEEAVLLDENIVAQDLNATDYFAVHSTVFSPSNREVSAFSVDLKGDEVYTIYISASGECTEVANNASGTIVWGADDQTIYFVRLDPELQRPFQWMEWKAGQLQVLHEEADERFWGDICRSSDENYVFWSSESSTQSETWALDLHTHTLECIASRRPKYTAEHRQGFWWILANMDDYSTSTKLYTAPVKSTTREWKLVDCINNSTSFNASDMSLDSLHTFPQHVVVQGRQEGLRCVWVAQLDDNNMVQGVEQLHFEESAHYVSLARRQDYHSNKVLVTYESMVTPPSFLEIDLFDTSQRQILHQQTIPGYRKGDYRCERLEVRSRDGTTKIPISLVYRRNANVPCPLHLLGYGAYGHSLEPSFAPLRLSLLKRGVVSVVAHVRGGGELGQDWYEAGKGLNKQNSSNDFVDVAKWLVESGWTTPDLLACEGRSAGGLLVAAAMNQEPSLFRAALLGVPFLDILSTMVDPSLPLTVMEWEEWGNPNEKVHFESIQKYAPMHNIRSDRRYPTCLLVGGLHDPRVSYWEPLKFAATLRRSTKLDRPVYVKIDTSAGHSFGSNRKKYFEELAFIYAFLLDELGAGR